MVCHSCFQKKKGTLIQTSYSGTSMCQHVKFLGPALIQIDSPKQYMCHEPMEETKQWVLNQVHVQMLHILVHFPSSIPQFLVAALPRIVIFLTFINPSNVASCAIVETNSILFNLKHNTRLHHYSYIHFYYSKVRKQSNQMSHKLIIHSKQVFDTKLSEKANIPSLRPNVSKTSRSKNLNGITRRTLNLSKFALCCRSLKITLRQWGSNSRI